MASQFHHVLTAARALSPRDKLELLQALSDDLQRTDIFDESTTQFWHLQSLDDILSAQATPVVTDVHTLAVDFWPEDETADDINDFIAAQRRADRE